MKKLKEKDKENEGIIISLKDKIRDLEKKLENQTNIYNNENLSIKNELNNSKKDNETIKNELNKIKKENLKKDNELKDLKKIKNNILEKKEDLEKNYKKIEDKLKNKEKELENQIKINNKLKENNKEKENEIIKLNEKYINIQKDLENKIEIQKNEYQSKLEEILNKNKILEQNNNELKNKIKEYEKKYNINKENLLKKYNEISEKEKVIENKIINLENEKVTPNKEKSQIRKDMNNNETSNEYNIQNPIYNIFSLNNKTNIIKKVKNNTKSNTLNNIKNEENNTNEKQNLVLSYSKPTLIGLNEIENESYMNATLQCLSQTIDLTNYFFKNKDKILKNDNKMGLSKAYLEILKKLWEKNGPKSFSPNDFKNKIEEINPIFINKEFGYNNNFLINLIEQIHKEQSKIVNFKYFSYNEELLNPYDKQNALKHFFDEFQKDCSIISDLFYGIFETNNVCLNCKNDYNSKGLINPISYNYHKFNYILFPLEAIKNLKNNLNPYFCNNQIVQNNKVTLYDCFKYYLKTETFNQINKTYCNSCQKLSTFEYSSKIYSCSKYVILILIRETNNVLLDINEFLDITEFISEKDSPNITYSLYGLITELNNNLNSYYIASCKSEIDSKWYRYNNDKVTPIINFQEEVIYFGKPCILMYKRN